MIKKIIFAISVIVVTAAACKKEKIDDTTTTTPITEQQILNDFANVLVNPDYHDLQAKASELNVAIVALSSSTTSANLNAAQVAWRAVRVPWEQSEGFLFGPVEDLYFDASTDSWPVNTTELDSLLSDTTNHLTLAEIDVLQNTLKGYHPIEYLLFGVGGSRVASELGARELQYLVSLSQNLYNTITGLRNSWDVNQPDNFTEKFVTAGQGSTRFATRKDAFLTIVEAMERICNEVANSKMQNPLAELDSEKAESQYAHNATIDFTNNIIGLQNVYFSRYSTNSGQSLHDLVSEKNSSLDNTIQSQISIAVAALQNIDPNYGWAIWNQQGQIHDAQQIINDLHDKLDLLTQFVQANIAD